MCKFVRSTSPPLLCQLQCFPSPKDRLAASGSIRSGFSHLTWALASPLLSIPIFVQATVASLLADCSNLVKFPHSHTFFLWFPTVF